MYIIYHNKTAAKGVVIVDSRSHLSAKEREIVSRIHKLIGKPGVLRANLVRMKRKCGNKNCRCAKGKLHKSWYLYQSKNGKSRMLYVPDGLAEDVKGWAQKNKNIRKSLDQLSEIYWDKVRRRTV